MENIDKDKEIERLKSELEQCKKEDEQKSEFISIMIHQLRTPLSGLKWSLRMLSGGDMGELSDEQKQLVEKGEESTQRMINLLEDIVESRKKKEWEFQYNFENVELNNLVSSIVNQYEEDAKGGNDLSLSFEGSEEDLNLSADPDKLSIVFENLVGNAIRYTNQGGTVTVTTDQDGDTAKVAVTDTGMGIPEDEQNKIFTKFFRAENAKEHNNEGSGLGLYTAKKVVDDHNGTIDFESTEGKGTTFYVTLPLSTMDN